MSNSGDDLFKNFNDGEVSEVLRRCVGCGRFVVIGPPRSGKTFFIKNHLRNNLSTNVIDEYTLGVLTVTSEVGSGRRERVGYLKRMISWIKKLMSKERVKDEELKRVLGDRAPKPVVEEAERRIGNSPHRAYYISWKHVEEPSECDFGADVGRALGLIKEVFGDRRIKWFSVDYVSPGLVKEVVDLIKKNEKEAKEELMNWANAYFNAIETLGKVLGVREGLLELGEVSIVLPRSLVNNFAAYVIVNITAASISVAALVLIEVLTHIAFKKKEKNYVKEIIELRKSLERLRVGKPGGGFEFNELGKLLVYRVAYVMGMSYDEAYEALMDITSLKTDELEKTVNEIKGKIEELEAKVNELNNWINLLKQGVAASITIADKADFEQGIVYPNISVEDNELRIRVENRYNNIVKTGKFNELINEVRGRLKSDGIVVVVGPKGIGKSTLAVATVWESLNNYEVGLIARVDVLNEDNYSKFQTFIENYSKEFVKYFRKLLILYDPVSTESYEEEPGTQPQQGESAEAYEEGARYARIPKDIEKTVGYLIKIKRLKALGDSGQTILIVLPSDVYNAVYNALSEGARNALEKYKLDVSQGLINTEFLAELIGEYTKTEDKPNGCALSDEKLSELAGNVAKFDSGHALIARLIGEELARNNCSVGEVKKLISEAKGKAEAFIILYINGLFRVHEDTDTAEALVKVFALRRPFIKRVRPGHPILTPGVVKLMDVTVLSGWLALRQHDLIEEAIGKLLDCIEGKGEGCKDLGSALEPWVPGTVKILREVSKKVSDNGSAVIYFVDNYGEKLTDTLRIFSNCWRRAALIIGYGLAGRVLMLKPEGLPEDLVESLGDALSGCGVDDYLLVGNIIPPLITDLIENYVRVLTEAFIDRYGEAIKEVNMVLNNARDRGYIYADERLYRLGLVSIIASAAGLGRPVEPDDAGVALRAASSAIQYVELPYFIKSVLGALEPLRGKAPHTYLGLLPLASTIEELDRDTVRYVFDELNKVLDNYGDRVKGHAPSRVYAIEAYAELLEKHRIYFDDDEVKGVVGRVSNLFNGLSRFKSSLDVIAWASALISALAREDVRGLMERELNINVVDRANEVLGELNELREKVQELMRDESFMSYVESRIIKADEKAVRWTILDTAWRLKHVLAIYRFDNDELDEAAKLFNEVAEEEKEIGDYEGYLVNRSLVLSVEAIEGSLVGSKLVDEFRKLYEEAFNEERFILKASYLSTASIKLGKFLVSLALTGGDERVKKIKELPWKHWLVLDVNKRVSVLTRLMLNALLGPKDRLDNELGGRLVVEPGELIEAFKDEMFKGLVYGLDGKSLVQLPLPRTSIAGLALMLYALINGDEKLAKAYALYGAVKFSGKLLIRLFQDVYRACEKGCDLSNEDLRQAITKLFLSHI